MDSFTRYAARSTSTPARSLASRLWDGALVMTIMIAVIILTHLDLIIWGALP